MQQAAHYQDRPNKMQMCSMCKFYISPGGQTRAHDGWADGTGHDGQANGVHKSAIVTARMPGKRYVEVSEEEQTPRGRPRRRDDAGVQARNRGEGALMKIVRTPAGRFLIVADAAHYHKVTNAIARQHIREGRPGWQFALSGPGRVRPSPEGHDAAAGHASARNRLDRLPAPAKASLAELRHRATAHRRRGVGQAAGALLTASPRRLLVLAVMALALGLSGCASLAAYEAAHPYYRFPASGFGVGGGPNG
jgi:hypothetical protein